MLQRSEIELLPPSGSGGSQFRMRLAFAACRASDRGASSGESTLLALGIDCAMKGGGKCQIAISIWCLVLERSSSPPDDVPQSCPREKGAEKPHSCHKGRAVDDVFILYSAQSIRSSKRDGKETGVITTATQYNEEESPLATAGQESWS